MKLIDGPIKEQIQEAIKAYDSLPNWIKEPEHQTMNCPSCNKPMNDNDSPTACWQCDDCYLYVMKKSGEVFPMDIEEIE